MLSNPINSPDITTHNLLPENESMKSLLDIKISEMAQFIEMHPELRNLDKSKFHLLILKKEQLAKLTPREKLIFTSIVMQKVGTCVLCNLSREFQLSKKEQQEIIYLTSDKIIDNIVDWNNEIKRGFEPLRGLTEEVLKKNDFEPSFRCYTNYVGNYKTILTVDINGETYVPSIASSTYINNYTKQKERENRPDFLTFQINETEFLFLAKFMGSQVIDYSNREHLKLVTDLALNFSLTGSESSTIDFNEGNLLINNNKIFYIDKDLFYINTENNTLENIKNLFFNIENNLFNENEKKLAKDYVKTYLRESLSASMPEDGQILDLLFLDDFGIYLNSLNFSEEGDVIKFAEHFPKIFEGNANLALKSIDMILLKIDSEANADRKFFILEFILNTIKHL